MTDLATTRPTRPDLQKAAALHLHYRQKYGVRESARILGLPSSTVHDWLRQGPKVIRNPRLRSVAQTAQLAHLAQSEPAMARAFGELAAIIGEDLDFAEQIFPTEPEPPEPTEAEFEAAEWDEKLHPRGPDGRWIRVGEIEDFLSGDRVRVNSPGHELHGQHGTVRGTGALGSLAVDLDNGESRAFSPQELEKAHTPIAEITKAEARGDSRPVSAEEFQRIAEKGEAQMAQRAENGGPPTWLDEHMDEVKDQTHQAVLQSWGGMTIDAHTGKQIPPGAHAWAITVKKPGQSSVSVPENPTPEQWSAALDKARTEFSDQLQSKDVALGVFHDDEAHRIDIDPNVIVTSLDDVESIGAYTHAIGGAYNFADGNGYWPPHVEAPATTNAAEARRGPLALPASDVALAEAPRAPPAAAAEEGPALAPSPPPPPPHLLDQLGAEAWHRFLNLLVNKVPAYRAVSACQRIDPDFSPSKDAIARAFRALGMEEGPHLLAEGDFPEPDIILLANWSAGHVAPPQYVLNLYDEYEMTAPDIADLSLRLRQMAEESYREGVNAQLSALGLDSVPAITDPQILNRIAIDAQKTAETIAGTYNSDLGGAVYEAWVDGLATRGRQMSSYHLNNSVNKWSEHRIGWKTGQIANTESTKWYNRAVQDFAERNYSALPQIEYYLTPDQCVCAACCALVANNPYTAAQAAAIPIPLHTNCQHAWVPVAAGAASGPLWTGQDYEAGQISASELGSGIFQPPAVMLEMAASVRHAVHGSRHGGSAQTLRDYWANRPTKHGKVSGITWGVGGDFYECVARVSKFMTPEQAKGYCALRHHQATGAWPGHAPAEKAAKAAGKALSGKALQKVGEERAVKSAAKAEQAHAEFPEWWFADWDPLKHPRGPDGRFLKVPKPLHLDLPDLTKERKEVEQYTGPTWERLETTAAQRELTKRLRKKPATMGAVAAQYTAIQEQFDNLRKEHAAELNRLQARAIEEGSEKAKMTIAVGIGASIAAVVLSVVLLPVLGPIVPVAATPLVAAIVGEVPKLVETFHRGLEARKPAGTGTVRSIPVPGKPNYHITWGTGTIVPEITKAPEKMTELVGQPLVGEPSGMASAKAITAQIMTQALISNGIDPQWAPGLASVLVEVAAERMASGKQAHAEEVPDWARPFGLAEWSPELHPRDAHGRFKTLHGLLTVETVTDRRPLHREARGKDFEPDLVYQARDLTGKTRLTAVVRDQTGRAIGIANYDQDSILGTSVSTVHIAKAHQGKGAGRALFEHLASNTPPGQRLTVHNAVPNGRRFYQHLGSHDMSPQFQTVQEFEPDAVDRLRGGTPLPLKGAEWSDFLPGDHVLAAPEGDLSLAIAGTVTGSGERGIEMTSASGDRFEMPPALLTLAEWEPELHPRVPKGAPGGGEFAHAPGIGEIEKAAKGLVTDFSKDTKPSDFKVGDQVVDIGADLHGQVVRRHADGTVEVRNIFGYVDRVQAQYLMHDPAHEAENLALRKSTRRQGAALTKHAHLLAAQRELKKQHPDLTVVKDHLDAAGKVHAVDVPRRGPRGIPPEAGAFLGEHAKEFYDNGGTVRILDGNTEGLNDLAQAVPSGHENPYDEYRVSTGKEFLRSGLFQAVDTRDEERPWRVIAAFDKDGHIAATISVQQVADNPEGPGGGVGLVIRNGRRPDGDPASATSFDPGDHVVAGSGASGVVAPYAEWPEGVSVIGDKVPVRLSDGSLQVIPVSTLSHDVSYYGKPQPTALHVGYLGSSHTTPGASSATEGVLAALAAKEGVGVTSEYIPDAKGYHRAIGRQVGGDETRSSSWSAADVGELAKEVEAITDVKPDLSTAESIDADKATPPRVKSQAVGMRIVVRPASSVEGHAAGTPGQVVVANPDGTVGVRWEDGTTTDSVGIQDLDPAPVQSAEPHFNPDEPRDSHGRWMRLVSRVEHALKDQTKEDFINSLFQDTQATKKSPVNDFGGASKADDFDLGDEVEVKTAEGIRHGSVWMAPLNPQQMIVRLDDGTVKHDVQPSDVRSVIPVEDRKVTQYDDDSVEPWRFRSGDRVQYRDSGELKTGTLSEPPGEGTLWTTVAGDDGFEHSVWMGDMIHSDTPAPAVPPPVQGARKQDDLAYVSRPLQQPVVQEIDRLAKLHPKAAGQIVVHSKKSDFVAANNGPGDNTLAVTAPPSQGTIEIALNPQYWSDSATLRSVLKSSARVQFSPVGGSGAPNSAIDHEWAHALAFYALGPVGTSLSGQVSDPHAKLVQEVIERVRPGMVMNFSPDTKASAFKVGDRLIGKDGTQYTVAPVPDWGKDFPGKNLVWVTDTPGQQPHPVTADYVKSAGMGGYASKSGAEFLAEAYALARDPNAADQAPWADMELAQAIADELDSRVAAKEASTHFYDSFDRKPAVGDTLSISNSWGDTIREGTVTNVDEAARTATVLIGGATTQYPYKEGT